MVREDVVEKHFNKMGAKVKLVENKPRWRRNNALPYTVDIETKGKEETFVIETTDLKSLDIQVLEVKPELRHLLLMGKDSTGEISKFLCGHDERHWFVAALPEGAKVRNIEDAMSALKPTEVVSAQSKAKVRSKDKHRRRNKGYVRQGEWFFIPEPSFNAEGTILRNEPIVRGRGKPHMCEELIRVGGEAVFVDSDSPNGITLEQYTAIVKKEPHKQHHFRRMTRGARVYVRGKITHKDHATVELLIWHRVVVNTESSSRAMRNMMFLD